jgi:hypothetical protein
MNTLSNGLKSVLELFASFVGTILIAVIMGVIGAFVNEYLGIALFLLFFTAGIVGSIKLYLMPQPT